MGFSYPATAAVLATSIIIVTTVFLGSFLPSVNNINSSFGNTKNRYIEQYQTNINISNITDVGWYDTSWSHRKLIVIDHDYISEDLSNFPVLINITDSDFLNYAQGDGDDFIFISSDNETMYNYELENFSGTGRLIAWVNITNVSADRDTWFFIYFGNVAVGSQENQEDTWNANYMAVWHMTDIYGQQVMIDSTNNDNTGVKKGSDEPLEGTENIFKCQRFDGAPDPDGDYVQCGADTSLVFGDGVTNTPFTMEAWLLFDDATSADFLGKYEYDLVDSSREYLFSTTGDDRLKITIWDEFTDAYRNETSVNSITPYKDCWHYYVATYTGVGSTFALYCDGRVMDSTSNNNGLFIAMRDTDLAFQMGRSIVRARSTNTFDGIMDEVRVSNIARDASWINATYNTASESVAFYSTYDVQNQNYTYLNITIGNTGSEVISLNKTTLITNGLEHLYVYLKPYLYPKEESNFLVNVSKSGTKRNKIITDTGRSAFVSYTFF